MAQRIAEAACFLRALVGLPRSLMAWARGQREEDPARPLKLPFGKGRWPATGPFFEALSARIPV